MSERSTNIHRYKRSKKRDYQNPFFPKQRKTKAPQSTSKGAITVIILLMIGVVLIAAQEHPYLHIKNIDITDAHLLGDGQIRAEVESMVSGRRALLRNDHLATIPTRTIKRVLKKKFALVEVDIIRQWPNSITIRVGEREPIMRVNYPPKHFSVIDQDGVVVISEIGTEIMITDKVTSNKEESTEEGDGSDQQRQDPQDKSDIETQENTTISSVVECTFCDTMEHLPLIHASSTPPTRFDPGTTLLPKDTVSSLRAILSRLPELSVPIDHIVIDETSPETAEIKATDGFWVYIDLSKDLNAQIANLSVLLQEKYPTTPRTLQYIDVRYGNRLYYQ